MDDFASLCAGGEGAGLGAQAAGLRHSWGVEYDPKIAGVAQRNGFALLVAAIEDVDYSGLAPPWWLHGSPSCKNASSANNDAGEAPEDLTAAHAIARAIRTLRPPMFSLENVWAYRIFESFRIICQALDEAGYTFAFWHLDAADFGIPQNRKRLILLASRVKPVRCPIATHHNPRGGQTSLFTAPWRGWYGAVADLIPTFKPSQLAPWQAARLPAELRQSLLVHPTDQRTMPTRGLDDPSFTVMAGSGGSIWRPRALLVGGANTNLAEAAKGNGVRGEGEHGFTLAGNSYRNTRAIIVSDYDVTLRAGEDPAITVRASRQAQARVILINGQANDEGRSVTVRHGDTPAFAVKASATKSIPKICLPAAQCFQINVRGLARLQSVPDTYWLPAQPTLACTVVGNMVPPDWMRQIVEANR